MQTIWNRGWLFWNRTDNGDGESQPWGIAQDLLMGFFCEAEGDAVIRMDPDELKYAEWVRREDIVLQPDNLSLINEMMRMYKEGKVQSETRKVSAGWTELKN